MKQFKDPIYGYIYIPKNIVQDIVDRPEFQRLRYIKQTSYLPVFSAALHNRFIHSLGVYYLGTIACDALLKNSEDIFEEYPIDSIDVRSVFQLACLLHDVGHAPFSHSGEGFYIDDRNTIHKEIKDIVKDLGFSDDVNYYRDNAKDAAPHEIMSVVVALKQFSTFFKSVEERDFFARCITGYKYRDAEKNVRHAILNAFISLLNSSTIDVDRLDYLIRDAFVMGYNSISIDYDRLLNSVYIVKVQDSADHTPIQLAYKKSALSVIENVIYAHDSEKKWIQNHPVILYEVFLIQRLLSSVKNLYKEKTGNELFSLDSLLPRASDDTYKSFNYLEIQNELDALVNEIDNQTLKNELFQKIDSIKDKIKILYTPEKISLLCDDDIIHLTKTFNPVFSKELFDRNSRHHPIWKSESEYKIYVDGFVGDESYDELQSQLKTFKKFLDEESPSHVIDDNAIKYCQEKLDLIPASTLSDADKQDMINRYELLLRWLKAFENIKKDQGLKNFNFVIVTTSNFESSFKKTDLKKTPIFFPETGKIYPLNKLINLFEIKDIDRRRFFYVYYKKEPGEIINALKVGKEIAKLVLA